MSSTATTSSLFTMGDVVLANPKESAALFAIVVILSVVLENVFGAFRENRSRYVKLLFLQVSEEIMIVGVIGLVFVFITQSSENMPTRWLLLFRWVQMILFVLMLFFIVGIVFGAFSLRRLIYWFRSEDLAARALEDEHGATGDEELVSPNAVHRAGKAGAPKALTAVGGSNGNRGQVVLHPQGMGVAVSVRQRLYFVARAIFVGHLHAIEEKARAEFNAMAQTRAARERTARQRFLGRLRGGNSMEDGKAIDELLRDVDVVEPPYIGEIRDVTLVDYMNKRSQDTMVKFTDITWQCWFSIIFLTSFNSIRMFVLPGDLQSKSSDEYTINDRMTNVMTYIFLIGWVPLVIFVAATIMLVRNSKQYLEKADERLSGPAADANVGDDGAPRLQMPGDIHAGGVSPRMKIGGTTVWLPPAELTAAMMGKATDDPSRNLLRGHRAFTMHMIKVPSLLIQLYMAMFLVGIWGQVSLTFEARQVYVIPLAIIPIIVSMLLVPIALLCVTLLTSLGSRIDEDAVIALARRRAAIAAGATEEEAEDALVSMKGANELATAELLAKATSNVEHNAESGAVLEKMDRLETMLAAMSNNNNNNGNNLGGNSNGNPTSAAQSPVSQSTEAVRERLRAQDSDTVLQLRSRVRFLEDLCVNYGLPIVAQGEGGAASAAAGAAPGGEQGMAAVVGTLNRLQEQMTRLQDQQQQMVAVASMGPRGAGADGGVQPPAAAGGPSAPLLGQHESVAQSRRMAGLAKVGPTTGPHVVQAPLNLSRDIAKARATPARSSTASIPPPARSGPGAALI